jgi:DNA-binding transcriptional ArsR family regulator
MPQKWLNYRDLGALLGCLSHPARLRIVDALAEKEYDVNALQELLRLSQTAVSQHLAQLRHAHVVIERREGRRVVYRLLHDELPGLLKQILEVSRAPVQSDNPWSVAPWLPCDVDASESSSGKKR